MLVLSRKPEEVIVIPSQGITFKVLAISGNKVRVGIVAPPDVTVYREEVWDRMQEGGDGREQAS